MNTVSFAYVSSVITGELLKYVTPVLEKISYLDQYASAVVHPKQVHAVAITASTVFAHAAVNYIKSIKDDKKQPTEIARHFIKKNSWLPLLTIEIISILAATILQVGKNRIDNGKFSTHALLPTMAVAALTPLTCLAIRKLEEFIPNDYKTFLHI